MAYEKKKEGCKAGVLPPKQKSGVGGGGGGHTNTKKIQNKVGAGVLGGTPSAPIEGQKKAPQKKNKPRAKTPPFRGGEVGGGKTGALGGVGGGGGGGWGEKTNGAGKYAQN